MNAQSPITAVETEISAVLEYETLDEAFDIVRQMEKPLAAYLFSHDRVTRDVSLQKFPSVAGRSTML
ncbi:MAG: hypothetical protein AAGA50_09115 [Pseudomonadota bacterium]